MHSILSLDSPAEDVQPQPAPVAPEESLAAEETAEDFEIVLGRTQVAGVLFVASVVVVVFSAISYLAGRALVPKPVTPPVVAAAPAPPPMPVLEATVVRAADIPAPRKAAAANDLPELPIFGNPNPSALYLQMGAVEKGIAVIMVDGLRKHGFAAFAAPGPTDVIYRVLIGPLADGEEFRRTKEKVDQIGLNSFARKYQP